MPAYVIASIDVHDPEGYEDYKRLSTQSAARHGGRFVVRGGAVEVLEGDWDPGRLVVLEFPDAEAARRWHGSEDYAEARAIRERTATSRLLVAEGV